MKILNLEQNSDEWFDARKGKVTGSSLGDVVVKRGTKRKVGFYQLIADRIAVEADDENVMDRGHRLEQEATTRFVNKTGKMVEHVGMCVSDFNDSVANSPDGLIMHDGKYTEALEVKCLSSARHLQAVIENEVPNEYLDQVVQYFIVNDDLQTLYLVFYDPRIPAKDFHIIPVPREDVAELVERYKEYQINILAEVDEWVEKLAF